MWKDWSFEESGQYSTLAPVTCVEKVSVASPL